LIKSLNFGIRILCLDREFYSIDVFDFLKNLNIPHITPVVKRGNRIKKILTGNRNRFDTYLMENSEKEILLNIAIDVKY